MEQIQLADHILSVASNPFKTTQIVNQWKRKAAAKRNTATSNTNTTSNNTKTWSALDCDPADFQAIAAASRV